MTYKIVKGRLPMRISCWNAYNIDTSLDLVSCLISRGTVTEFAAQLEKEIKNIYDIINELLCLKANLLCEYPDELESQGYSEIDDEGFLSIFNRYFILSALVDADSNELKDHDYLAIANLRFPGQFDDCAIIKGDFRVKNVFQRDLSTDNSHYYTCSYRVLVRKGKRIDYFRDYPLHVIIDLVKAGDILIINSIYEPIECDFMYDRRNVYQLSDLVDLNMDAWLKNARKPSSPFFSCYIEYLKQCLAEETIDECIKGFVDKCIRLLLCPSDKKLREAINYVKYSEVFKGMKAKERLRYIKQLEKSQDFINRARDIIVSSSDNYKFIMQYSD